MICPACRDNDHAQCEDAKHPHRVYRGCGLLLSSCRTYRF